MKIVVIDGQGGKMGAMLVEQILARLPGQELVAIGTNSLATAAMLRAGAQAAATGENPVVFNCADADAILGPMGIIAANSLLGEVTPAMAQAVGHSPALKLLIPLRRCNIFVAGVQDQPPAAYIRQAVDRLVQMIPQE